MRLGKSLLMSDIVDSLRPIAGYDFRSFLVHKPVGVVSSTVDTGPSELVKNKKSPRYGLTKNVPPRQTVYDVAEIAGFPTDCGLVGRLDLETSGIMVRMEHFTTLTGFRPSECDTPARFCTQLFSNDTRLADAIRDPPKSGSPLEMSAFKTKEYELKLLSSIKYDLDDFFDIPALEESLSEPFTFQKVNIYHSRSVIFILSAIEAVSILTTPVFSSRTMKYSNAGERV